MALPLPHRRFAKNELEHGLGAEVNGMVGIPPHDRAISEMETFSAQVIRLLPRVDQVEPGMIFESSRALLDLLSWLANTVFKNALGRYPLQKKRDKSWKYAENRVLDLRRSVQDLAGLHAYVPDTGTDTPIDSALELMYTSVLSSVEPVDFGRLPLILTPRHTSLGCFERIVKALFLLNAIPCLCLLLPLALSASVPYYFDIEAPCKHLVTLK
jgi:hypothetical protein